MLLRMWSNRNSHSLLVETLNGTVSVEGRWAVSYKAVHTLTRKSEKVSPSDVSNSLQLRGLQPTRLLCPWHSPGKNTGVCCHTFLQRKFPTQVSNPGLLHCRQLLYHLSYLGSLGTTQMNWNFKSTQKPSCGCYFNLTQNWQNLKVTQMLFSWWIDKWTVCGSSRQGNIIQQ